MWKRGHKKDWYLLFHRVEDDEPIIAIGEGGCRRRGRVVFIHIYNFPPCDIDIDAWS